MAISLIDRFQVDHGATVLVEVNTGQGASALTLARTGRGRITALALQLRGPRCHLALRLSTGTAKGNNAPDSCKVMPVCPPSGRLRRWVPTRQGGNRRAMLNLKDGLSPREIEAELIQYQERNSLPSSFSAWLLEDLARSKDGYLVYDFEPKHTAQSKDASMASATHFGTRKAAESSFGATSRAGRVLVQVVEADQEHHSLWRTISSVTKRLSALEDGIQRLRGAIQRISDPIDADEVESSEGEDAMADDARLAHEAQEILRAAAAGDGDIMYIRTMGRPGVTIQAGGRSLIPSDADARTVAFWIGGLEDLEACGYIRGTGSRGEMFEVTREGYKAADELSE